MGSPTLATKRFSIKTFDCPGVSSVVVPVQICPVDNVSVCLQVSGISIFIWSGWTVTLRRLIVGNDTFYY